MDKETEAKSGAEEKRLADIKNAVFRNVGLRLDLQKMRKEIAALNAVELDLAMEEIESAIKYLRQAEEAMGGAHHCLLVANYTAIYGAG